MHHAIDVFHRLTLLHYNYTYIYSGRVKNQTRRCLFSASESAPSPQQVVGHTSDILTVCLCKDVQRLHSAEKVLICHSEAKVQQMF